MPEILIDIMRLLFRQAAWMLPTGIDYVSLEYIRHSQDGSRAGGDGFRPHELSPLDRLDSTRLPVFFVDDLIPLSHPPYFRPSESRCFTNASEICVLSTVRAFAT